MEPGSHKALDSVCMAYGEVSATVSTMITLLFQAAQEESGSKIAAFSNKYRLWLCKRLLRCICGSQLSITVINRKRKVCFGSHFGRFPPVTDGHRHLGLWQGYTYIMAEVWVK